jgi:hypothetical protein
MPGLVAVFHRARSGPHTGAPPRRELARTARRAAERRCLVGIDRPDQQAAKSGDKQAGRTECSGVLKRRVSSRRSRRPDDSYDNRDTKRGSDLARDRIRPGRRRETPTGCGGDRRDAQVWEQRAPPIPSNTIPGGHSPTNSGVTPTRSTNHITAPPKTVLRPEQHRTFRASVGTLDAPC